jgi:uncharacterized membrane protein YkvA (DUF1232 family)
MSTSREPLIIDAMPERMSQTETTANTEARSRGATGAATTPRRPTWKRVLLGVLALLYILSPLDLVPDWIPFVGWLDDIGVLAWAARQVFFKK